MDRTAWLKTVLEAELPADVRYIEDFALNLDLDTSALAPSDVRAIREELGETQEQFQFRFAVSKQSVSRWEHVGVRGAQAALLREVREFPNTEMSRCRAPAEWVRRLIDLFDGDAEAFADELDIAVETVQRWAYEGVPARNGSGRLVTMLTEDLGLLEEEEAA